MQDIRLSFRIHEIPTYAIAHKGGRKTLDINVLEGTLSCDVFYDFRTAPLTLRADVTVDDEILLRFTSFRIELYVNGTLCDEEWPAGERLYGMGDELHTPLTVLTEADPVAVEERLPSVIGTFENAEGWRPGGGVYVGDCMPYVKGDTYHVLYLKDRHHHKSKWGLGAHQWEHVSTKDFKTWEIHPMAVAITDSAEGSVCTGSWMMRDGVEYLFYTIRMSDGSPAPIRRSISRDGYHFEKDPDFSFTLPPRYHGASARDPKVVRDAEGVFHMFLTTSLVPEDRGCLAHFISHDLDRWEDAGEPIYVSPDSDQPECPDYICYGGRYYLVFSHHGRAHYLYSDRPFDSWQMPRDPIIPCAAVPKGAVWQDKIVFTGFARIREYAGTMTFRTAYAAEDGEWIFGEGMGT